MFGYRRNKAPSCKPSSETEPTIVTSPPPERTPKHSTEDTFAVPYPWKRYVFGPVIDGVTATETDDELDRLAMQAVDAMEAWMHAINERVRRG